MKIAVIGIDFPLGKHSLPDGRLEKLKSLFHSPKLASIQIEFQDKSHLKDCDSIICDKGVKLDLILADLEIIEGRLGLPENKDLMERCNAALNKEIFLNEIPVSEAERGILLNLNLVTVKPVTMVDKDNLTPIPEIILNAFSHGGMISFFTVNEKELHAWPLKKGSTVYEAAGYIHSDIQRGFIKAEIVGFEDLIKSGGINQAKGKGLARLEDKGYIVRDGDLIQIRFNV